MVELNLGESRERVSAARLA